MGKVVNINRVNGSGVEKFLTKMSRGEVKNAIVLYECHDENFKIEVEGNPRMTEIITMLWVSLHRFTRAMTNGCHWND